MCLQEIEALFKDVQKKVPGFTWMQGEAFKRALNTYAQMKSGSKWELKDICHQEALNIVAGRSAAANAPAGDFCNAFMHCEHAQGIAATTCWHMLSAVNAFQFGYSKFNNVTMLPSTLNL